MIRLRYLILTILLVSSTYILGAQDREVSLKVSGGYNAPFGVFAATSLETHQPLCKNFHIDGGLRYSSIRTLAAEARPAFSKTYSWGKLTAEAILAYTNLSSVNNLSFGAGAGVFGKWIGFKLGYYYRLLGKAGNFINEPFNIYYELRANFLPMIEEWDLQFLITNSELCQLERHFQPTFIAQCSYYFPQHIGLTMGIGCKPAGMFNMSADFYESYLKLGVCYRW